MVGHCKIKLLNMSLDRDKGVDVPEVFPYGLCLTEGDVVDFGVMMASEDDVAELNEAGFPNSRLVHIEGPVDDGRVLSLLADIEDDVKAVKAYVSDENEEEEEDLVDLFNSSANSVYGIRDTDDEVEDSELGFDLAHAYGVSSEDLYLANKANFQQMKLETEKEEALEGFLQDDVGDGGEEDDDAIMEDFFLMDPAVLSMARKVNRRVTRGLQIRDGVDDDAVVSGLTQGQLNRLEDRMERRVAEITRNELLESPDADDLFEEEEGFEGWMSDAL